MLDYCCSYFYMVSPTAYDADPDGFATHPVGTGAYVFDHKDETTGYVYLTANEDYFQGAPAFKNLEVHTALDSATALIAMENGELDLYLTPTNSDYEIALENDALKTGTTTGWTQMTLVTFGEPYISDPNLRKAIMYAVNAEKAAEYLAQSNYNGETLEINVTSLAEQVAVSVGYDLDSIGIKNVINVVDMNTWVSKIFDGTCGITASSLGGSYGCLEELMLTFSSMGYYGSMGIVATDETADAALAEALEIADAAERAPKTVEAYALQADLANMRGLFEDVFHVIYRADLDGVRRLAEPFFREDR